MFEIGYKRVRTMIENEDCCMHDLRDGVFIAKVNKKHSDWLFVTTFLTDSRQMATDGEPEVMTDKNHKIGTTSTGLAV